MSHLFLFQNTLLSFLLLHPMSYADSTNLVYKVCAEQKLDDPFGIYSQNLQTLLVSLVLQSEQKSFFTTTSGEGQNVIMGLYQCREDISNSACNYCVSMILDMLDMLCGKVVSARVQLIGCYLRYEVVGLGYKVVVPETKLIYKVCGSKKESYYSDGFKERRDSAFGMVESDVRNGGNLFYAGSYKSLYVLGQCEGDLVSDDCADCVKSAVDQAKAECSDSIFAQIYLHKCFISYSFCSKGVSPMPSSSPEFGSGSPWQQDNTLKTVVITVGVFAALGFLIVCFLALKSAASKKKSKNMYHSDSE